MSLFGAKLTSLKDRHFDEEVKVKRASKDKKEKVVSKKEDKPKKRKKK